MNSNNVEHDDSEESVLDRPQVCTLTNEQKNKLRAMMDEHNRNPLQYQFIWKSSIVMMWVPALRAIRSERVTGIHPIDYFKKYPDLPNVNSVQELSILAHERGWERAGEITGLDLDDKY